MVTILSAIVSEVFFRFLSRILDEEEAQRYDSGGQEAPVARDEKALGRAPVEGPKGSIGNIEREFSASDLNDKSVLATPPPAILQFVLILYLSVCKFFSRRVST